MHYPSFVEVPLIDIRVGVASGEVVVGSVGSDQARSFTVMGVNALIVLEQYPEMHRQARRAVVQLLADGAIDPMVGRTFAFESLRNAFRHSHAKRIEVRIRYDRRQFWLQIVDNGKGIDPAVLSTGGRAGHHGLPGIHERADLAGGKLSVWSRLDSGTEIELTIPGSIAYTKSPPDRSSCRRRARSAA